jgi:hypothetical protein
MFNRTSGRTFGRTFGRRAALLLATGLAGCKLIDQSTFRRAEKPAPPTPPPPPPPAPPPSPALATIKPEPGLDIRAALAPTVRAALARKPDATFDIVSVGGTADALAGLAPTASAAAQAIRGLGVAGDRIRLAARLAAETETPVIRIEVH